MLNRPLHNEELEQEFSGSQSDIQIQGDNPFPGLRSFSIDESYLFFGREGQVDELLNKISKHHFVTVLGYSGSGKSSLMYCGLVPALYGGFMTASGPHWNVLLSRPGASPIKTLVNSVVDYLLKNSLINPEDADIHRAVINATLRSGANGLVEVARSLQTKKNENIFILIDQFEEIFRYRNDLLNDTDDSENETQFYVKLILTAIQQTDVPVYIALTMRSDFIGECSVFAGLTEVINESNYLVPQMTRDEKRAAIEGPIAVAGGRISPRLVKRLLSDMGNNQDQLPILQHALMRSWDYWLANREPGEVVDTRHYNAIGKIHQALSLHANETYDELSGRQKEIAEVIFKNITEKSQDNRTFRKPCRLSLIAELAEASEGEVIEVIEHFRKPGRSFLMPPAHVALTGESIIELSHESLMRIWNRLASWVEDESESASMYKRLSEAAAMYQIGKTGLWRPPDLQLALNWQKKQRPTREWAQRYDDAFERAIVFLDTSRITYEAELKNQEMMQRRVLRRTRATAIILGVAFLVAILFFLFAYIQKIQADGDRLIAEQNKIEADKQREEALLQKNEAQRLKEITEQRARELEAAKDLVESYLKDARTERDRAEEALLRAKVEEERAYAAGEQEKAARELAELKTEEAKLNLDIAGRLYMLAVAQNLATKSVQEDDDKELALLQAMQGFIFHKRYEGRKYDPYIYRGLYQAITKTSGLNYNAIRTNNNARVHMRSVVLSSKNSKFFVAGADGKLYEGDYNKLAISETAYKSSTPSKVIALSGDESYLVNGSDSSFIQIYPITGNGNQFTIRGLPGATNDLEFLPDNSGFIVASREKKLSLVKHQTGEVKLLTTLPSEVKSITISANGKWLAGASWSGQIYLVNLTDYSTSVIVNEENKVRILSVEFSGDGKSLAYGVEDIANNRGLVRLLDLTTKEVRQFTGHRAAVYDVEFSPDGKLLASAGLDRRLQLYILDSPESLPLVMDNNNGYIWDIEFDKHSNYLIAGCSVSEVRVWPTDPALLAELICPKLTRNMTADEWKKYVGNDIDYELTCESAATKDY